MNEKEQLIQKLYSNQCSQEELKLLFDLIEEDDSIVAPDVMTTILEQMGEVSPLDLDTSQRVLQNVLKNTTEKELSIKNQSNQLITRISITWIGRVAAASLLLFIAIWFVYSNTNPSISVQTAYGQQHSIELPDGSKVELNANSSLTYIKNWDGDNTRQVWLAGEAFFEVEKKAKTGQKFQVITNDLTVEVLGTVFNVNTHQKQTKVFLQEGKVNLRLNGLEQAMLMAPGEIVEYSKSKKEHPKKHQVLGAQHTSWKYGLLLFDNTPLSEVLEKVEEIYGVKIHAKDSVNFKRKLNTGLPTDNLEETISLLELTLGLEILKEEENYIIQ